MNVDDFPSFDNIPEPWLHLTGAPLVRAMAQHDMSEHRDSWLALAKPALMYEAEPTFDDDFENDQNTPIGATKIHGLPDLPLGSKWPTQKDCKNLYDPNSGIDPAALCGFVAQINFAELAGTQLGRRTPIKGLLSIFSCAEIESIGMVDGFIIFTPETDNLVRLEPPEALKDDEANQILDAREGLTLTEQLHIPAVDDESVFETFRYSYDQKESDRHDLIVEDAKAKEMEAIGGYTQQTTGSDHLPGPEWCKLICVENTIGMTLHFCIRIEDLAKGNFDDVSLSWVDFD